MTVEKKTPWVRLRIVAKKFKNEIYFSILYKNEQVAPSLRIFKNRNISQSLDNDSQVNKLINKKFRYH